MSRVNDVFATRSVFGALSASCSPQMALTMLQMDLARTNKEQGNQVLTGLARGQ